jgi:hypothetical protein
VEKPPRDIREFSGIFKTDIHLTDEEINACIASAHAEAGTKGLKE